MLCIPHSSKCDHFWLQTVDSEHSDQRAILSGVCLYLISEQDFNGEPSSSRRDVFDCERVVGVGNDIKIHVSLFVADHVGVTLNPNADITWTNTVDHNHIVNIQLWLRLQIISFRFSVYTGCHKVALPASVSAQSIVSSQKHFTPPGWCIAKNSNINNKPPVQHNRHSLQHKTRAINHNRGIQSMRDKKRTRNHVRQQKLPTPEGKPLITWNHSWETPQKPFFFLYRVLADDLHNSLLSQRKSSNYPTAHTVMFKNLILED